MVRQKAIADLQSLSLREARGSGDFACTACRERYSLAPFEQRTDQHGTIYDLWICLNCLAILNATHLRAIHKGADFLSWQSDSSEEFYAVDNAYLATVPDAIDACGFIDFLLSAYPEQSRSVFLDFGAGRGILSGAAAKRFEKVYAVELSLNVLRKVHAAMPERSRIVPSDNYLDIKDGFDAVASMHVLEHLPNMRDILDTLVERMNPGGSLFFQAPMLRRDYLVNVHYTFFTEVSARTLCRNLGLETVGIWFDHALDFLTCIAKKPS
ncbi:bifunctional 2-polyprenyl-6-hydroxyphenol methylase/3-demethylubiquinol 3-O-methyltransferase UbiG [Sphingobium sp. CFD-2]|uniref:class I SAM-dependent methyltransferase n=1 Tax=Sphingobium sp. CFD-2 TaxID=2878542 RepID=UPI00214C39FD|nr:class I SAM-dependent methyltransferase [Sphingobium sp. CFD-2]